MLQPTMFFLEVHTTLIVIGSTSKPPPARHVPSRVSCRELRRLLTLQEPLVASERHALPLTALRVNSKHQDNDVISLPNFGAYLLSRACMRSNDLELCQSLG